jgi:hypothetical protein
VNLGYCLGWFQSLQLPSTQSESPLFLIPLAPKFHASLKSMYSTVNRIFHFSYFDPDYPTTGLARVYCIYKSPVSPGFVKLNHAYLTWRRTINASLIYSGIDAMVLQSVAFHSCFLGNGDLVNMRV